MQLQMTAPMDIGLDLQDASLGGQDDIFDLQGAEKGMRRRGGVSKLIGADGVVVEDSDSEDDGNLASEDELLDSEEEREKKTRELEAEMDGLYDSYQERLRERDAKFKVKEAREKNKEREAWTGINEDSVSDEDDSDTEGGWEKMQQAKGRNDDSSSSDESDDEDIVPAKKKRPSSAPESSREAKRARLLTRLKEPIPSDTQASKVWFSQDIFAGIDNDLQNIEDEDESEDGVDAEMEDDESVSSEEQEAGESDWDDEVSSFSSFV